MITLRKIIVREVQGINSISIPMKFISLKSPRRLKGGLPENCHKSGLAKLDHFLTNPLTFRWNFHCEPKNHPQSLDVFFNVLDLEEREGATPLGHRKKSQLETNNFYWLDQNSFFRILLCFWLSNHVGILEGSSNIWFL